MRVRGRWLLTGKIEYCIIVLKGVSMVGLLGLLIFFLIIAAAAVVVARLK